MALAEPAPSEPWVPTDTFGSRLALIRQHFGWNVLEAATACGLNDQTWRNWEAGTSPRGMDKVARQIADATGCDYRWLLVGNGCSSTNPWSPVVFDGADFVQQEFRLGERQLATVGG